MVLQCDKNTGSLIISKNDYNHLLLNYLEENKENYTSINENPLNNTIKIINETLHK